MQSEDMNICKGLDLELSMLNSVAGGLIFFVGSKSLPVGSWIDLGVARIFALRKNDFFQMPWKLMFVEEIENVLKGIVNIGVENVVIWECGSWQEIGKELRVEE